MKSKPINPELVLAVARNLELWRQKVPSEVGHPIITRQWLYDLSKLLLECARDLSAAVREAKQ